MKGAIRRLAAAAVIMLVAMMVVACTPQATPPAVVTPPVPQGPKNSVPLKDLAGSYEGEWAMSPNMKPLASLVLTTEQRYQVYLSITGLLDEGKFEIQDDKVISFVSDGAGSSAIKGKYNEGVLTVGFPINKQPTEIAYKQVGTPQDVYKPFLGDYVTKVMGKTDVLLSLRPNRKYVNHLSKETGTFKISNGQITLTPSTASAIAVQGTINPSNNEIAIQMSVMPGTPAAKMTFTKVPEKSMAVYKGNSSVGMSGSTAVQLTFKPGNAFALQTSSPRGVGTYEVVEKDGKLALTLTYLDPAKTPEGAEFRMVGTTSNKDLWAAGNVIVIESVEYIVSMEGNASIMKLGKVEFRPASE